MECLLSLTNGSVFLRFSVLGRRGERNGATSPPSGRFTRGMVRLRTSVRAGDGEPSSLVLTQRSRFRLPHCRKRFGSPGDLSARGLGDPETTLTKIHPVCPPSLGRQPVARWYFPPEVDYRLSLLHPDAKGLVVWVMEAKVLSKAELQFLAILPDIRPKVRVIAECGNWRKFVWKPLKQIAGLEPDPDAEE